MIDAEKKLSKTLTLLTWCVVTRTVVATQFEKYFAESALYNLRYYATDSLAARKGD